MNKPKKPRKKIEVSKNKRFYFVSKQASLDDFLDWIKVTVPKNAKEASICLDEEFDGYEGEYSGCYIMVEWKEKINNPFINMEMKRYQKKLAKYKKVKS